MLGPKILENNSNNTDEVKNSEIESQTSLETDKHTKTASKIADEKYNQAADFIFEKKRNTILGLIDLISVIKNRDKNKLKANIPMLLTITFFIVVVSIVSNMVQQQYAKSLYNSASSTIISAANSNKEVDSYIASLKNDFEFFANASGESSDFFKNVNCKTRYEKYGRELILVNQLCKAGKDFFSRYAEYTKKQTQLLTANEHGMSITELSNNKPNTITTADVDNLDKVVMSVSPIMSNLFVMFYDDNHNGSYLRRDGIYYIGTLNTSFRGKPPTVRGIETSSYYSKDQIQYWVDASNSIWGELIFSLIFLHFFIRLYNKVVKDSAIKEKKISLEKSSAKLNKELDSIEKELSTLKIDLRLKEVEISRHFNSEQEHLLLEEKLKAENSYKVINESNSNMINNNNTQIVGLDIIINKAIVDDIESRYNIEALDFVELNAHISNIKGKLNKIPQNNRNKAQRGQLADDLRLSESKFDSRYSGIIKSDLEELVNRYTKLTESKAEKLTLQEQNSNLIQERLNAENVKEHEKRLFDEFTEHKSILEAEVNTYARNIEAEQPKINRLKKQIQQTYRAISTLNNF